MSSKNYEAMTRAERRVAIAQDVIDTINAKKIKVARGYGYVSLRSWETNLPFNSETADELMPQCMVCARGAMMLCRIAKFNSKEINLGDTVESEDTARVLNDAFNAKQLARIEDAFEGWGSTDEEALEFGGAFDNEEDRLIAICQNIIDHKGTFSPKCQYEML